MQFGYSAQSRLTKGNISRGTLVIEKSYCQSGTIIVADCHQLHLSFYLEVARYPFEFRIRATNTIVVLSLSFPLQKPCPERRINFVIDRKSERERRKAMITPMIERVIKMNDIYPSSSVSSGID